MYNDNSKITFFIGNGFDMNMKLKTSYEEYFKWYCENGDISKEFKDYLKRRLAIAGRANSWGDCYLDLYEYLNHNAKEKQAINHNIVKDFLANLIRYLLEQSLEAKEYIHGLSDEYLGKLKELFVHFGKLLDKEEYEALQMVRPDIENLSEDRFCFVNFNYTSVADYVIGRMFKEPYMIHTHGRLNGEHDSIMDLSIVLSSFLFEKSDNSQFFVFQDPKKIRALQAKWNAEIEKLMSESSILCIYGMAIGATDRIWWKKIINWLELPDHELIIYWYKKRNVRVNSYLKEMILEMLFQYEDNIDLNINRDYLSQKTHIIFIDNNTLKQEKKFSKKGVDF